MVEFAQLLFPLFGLLLVAGGVSFVRKGLHYSRKSDRIAETPVSDVESLHRGTVAVQGTARVDEDEGTVTTALTGEEALVSTSKVSTKDADRDPVGESDDMRAHSTIHDETRTVPFLVEDGTGTVRVEPPEEPDVRLDRKIETVRNRRMPEVADLAADPAAATAESITVGDTPQLRDYRRRYEQGAIAPGEEVYVLGEAVSRADWDGSEFAITGGDDPAGFVVSDLSPEEVRTGGKIGAYLAYAFGGLMALLGALLLFGGIATLL